MKSRPKGRRKLNGPIHKIIRRSAQHTPRDTHLRVTHGRNERIKRGNDRRHVITSRGFPADRWPMSSPYF